MARPRRFEIDEALLRPGTYFNPETEVLIVVDDSPDIDQAAFEADAGHGEGADWVLIADEVPIDEAARDELLEAFQATYQGGGTTPALDEDGEPGEIDADEDEDELEPDEEPDEL